MPNVPLESYRRVYPEWKPSTSLEKADIVGTIEALAGMTCTIFNIIFYRLISNQFFV